MELFKMEFEDSTQLHLATLTAVLDYSVPERKRVPTVPENNDSLDNTEWRRYVIPEKPVCYSCSRS